MNDDVKRFLSGYYSASGTNPKAFVFGDFCYAFFVHEMGYSEQQAREKDLKYGLTERLREIESVLTLLGLPEDPREIDDNKMQLYVLLAVSHLKQALISGGDEEYMFQHENGVLYRYNGDAAIVIVPEYITEIGEEVFKDDDFEMDEWQSTAREFTDINDSGNPRLKCVVLPPSVKKIGRGAFYNCRALERVHMDGVEEIADRAFSGCKSLKLANMPSVREIGSEAFFECSALESVSLPMAERILDEAFSCARIATAVTLPSSLKRVGKYAFKGALSGEFTLPSGIEYIGEGAFSYGDITSLTLSEGIKEVPKKAFSNCKQLKRVTFPSSLENICERAFSECQALSKVLIPRGVKEIGEKAFYNCYIKSLCLTKGALRVIGEYAFMTLGFYKDEPIVSSVVVPEGVEAIMYDAFSTKFREVIIPSTVRTLMPQTAGKLVVSADNPHYYTDGIALFKREEGGTCLVSVFNREISSYAMDNGVRAIKSGAFSGLKNLTELVLSEALTEIPPCAFYLSFEIKRLVVPSSVTKISEQAFLDCAIEDLFIPDSVTEIGERAFGRNDPYNNRNNKDIRRITLPKRFEQTEHIWGKACPAEIVYY